MSDPLVDPSDLGVYLNDDSLDEDRAALMIRLAQDLCETVIDPLPAAAAGIVLRVAHRGYISITSGRQYQLDQADSMYGAGPSPAGGIYLMRNDESDLKRFAPGGAGGGAFSINTVPSDLGYVPDAWRPW